MAEQIAEMAAVNHAPDNTALYIREKVKNASKIDHLEPVEETIEAVTAFLNSEEGSDYNTLGVSNAMIDLSDAQTEDQKKEVLARIYELFVQIDAMNAEVIEG